MEITIEELNNLLQKEFERGRASNSRSIKEQLEHYNKLGNYWNETPEHCRNCPNHPSNGGNGMCDCILGDSTIT